MFFCFATDLSKNIFQLILLFSDSPLDYKKYIYSVKYDLNFSLENSRRSLYISQKGYWRKERIHGKKGNVLFLIILTANFIYNIILLSMTLINMLIELKIEK